MEQGTAMKSKARKGRGFTLIELMMVVLIMGILLAVVLPNVMGSDDRARLAAAKGAFHNIASALDMYRIHNGHYPSEDQGLQALVTRPSGYPSPKDWGPEPYLRKLPVDPWGNEFIYTVDGSTFDIMSLGSDGAEGGEGVDADISYSEM